MNDQLRNANLYGYTGEGTIQITRSDLNCCLLNCFPDFVFVLGSLVISLQGDFKDILGIISYLLKSGGGKSRKRRKREKREKERREKK